MVALKTTVSITRLNANSLNTPLKGRNDQIRLKKTKQDPTISEI